MTESGQNTSRGDVPLGFAPLVLEPRFVERIWGTHDLQPYFGPRQAPTGEVWLTAEECAVVGSAATLREAVLRQPEALGAGDGNGFPLLIKLLYPREKLSVQVHPDDAQARSLLGQPRGKTECWYVLHAELGAEVAVGFREPLRVEDVPLTVQEVRAAIADGSLEQKLRMLPVKAGDMVFVDAGTVHAIGPGMVVLETQQYSDVTYRLWDYGRPRELHVEQGLAVTRTETAAGLVAPVAMDGFDRLLACPYFAVDRFRLEGAVALGEPGRMQILIALGEGAAVQGGGASNLALPVAQAVVLPAGDTGWQVQGTEAVEVIRVLAQG